jgi:hypothetical protein
LRYLMFRHPASVTSRCLTKTRKGLKLRVDQAKKFAF